MSGTSMLKSEIAERLGVPVEKIHLWADRFADWLDSDSRSIHKTHDVDDLRIFARINELDGRIDPSVSPVERSQMITHGLNVSSLALRIRRKRASEKALPEVARWQVVGASKLDYEWLAPLQPSVTNVVDFGCWASDMDTTCSEPYALLWTLEAARIVVIDKKSHYIQNARAWLDNVRQREPYFQEYDLRFHVGDLTQRISVLDDGGFDLSYCRDVLYNMGGSPEELRASINEMTRVVRPGGWIIAIEPKMGVEFQGSPIELLGGRPSMPPPTIEPTDISSLFETNGLQKYDLPNAPDGAYCYRKPLIGA